MAVGALLAMRPVSARIAAAALLLALAACGNTPTGTDPQQLLGRLIERTADDDGAAQVRTAADLTRADIAAITLPLMRVAIPEIGGVATASLAAVNQGVETWQSPDGSAVLLDGPVLFGTRGIGWDLMTAETAQPRRLLQTGAGGSYTRVLRHYDGENQLIPVAYACVLQQQGAETITVLERRHATRRAVERCTAPDGTGFENVYWVGGGVLWKSRQWISPRLGMLVTERLVP